MTNAMFDVFFSRFLVFSALTMIDCQKNFNPFIIFIVKYSHLQSAKCNVILCKTFAKSINCKLELNSKCTRRYDCAHDSSVSYKH